MRASVVGAEALREAPFERERQKELKARGAGLGERERQVLAVLVDGV